MDASLMVGNQSAEKRKERNKFLYVKNKFLYSEK
jgi:hypothetical protein